MLSSVEEAVNDICAENGAERVDAQDNPKSPSLADAFNVVVSTEDRQDLVKKGWNHRGIVGANIYFIKGGEEKEVKANKPKAKSAKCCKSAPKKSTSRKK